MRYLLFLFGIFAFAQQNLEDWACGSGAIPTAGNPTTFTCPSAHNFKAGTYISVWMASGGSWPSMNTGETIYLRQSISATSPASGAGVLYVNDTLYLPQTGNFEIELYTGTIEHLLVNVASSDTLNVVTRGYNSTTAQAAPLECEVVGPLSLAASYPITVTGSNTFTIPYNSTGYGTYSGNSIIIQRTSFTYTSTPSPLLYTSIADGVGEVNVQPTGNGNALLVIPGCPSPSSSNQGAAYECARGFIDPGNQKGYGGNAQVSNLVVSGGTGTITLSSAYTYNGQEGNRTLGANQLIWLQGMNEGSNAFNSINRPWIMSAVNGPLTQITVPGMGGQGVADGTYTVASGTKNFWFPPPQSLYYYFQGDSGNGASFPSGYTQQLIKNGGSSFNTNDNRVNMYVCWGKNFSPYATGTGSFELGNYFALQPSGTTYHGYQSLHINGYSGQCGLYAFTANFQHLVGESVPAYLPNQFPPNGAPGGDPWTGESSHKAWEVVYRWYLNAPGFYSDQSGQTVTLGKLTMDYTAAEPEEYVINRGVIYTGSAYEIDLQVPEASFAGANYQFRWSTSDMKTNGFSTGICKSGTTTCNNSDSVASPNDNNNQFLSYTSAALAAPSPTIYWGIRPTIPVSGSSGNSQSPIWITTDYDPNFAVGDHVTVAGLTGNTAGNQTAAAITGVQARQTWWYTTPTASWPTGATADNLTNIVSNGSTCTVNLTVNHNIFPGWKVLIYSTVTGDITHGYRYTVASTPTTKSFTYACAASAGTYASDSNPYHMAVQAEPGFSLAGTGNGNWAGETGATVIATDDTKNFAEIVFAPPGSVVPGSGLGSFSQVNAFGAIRINEEQK